MRAATARLDDDELSGRSVGRLPLMILAAFWRVLRRRPRDSMAAAVAGLAALAILVNALFLQSGPHPAPIFANLAPPVAVPLTGAAAALAQHKAEAGTAALGHGGRHPARAHSPRLL